MELQGRGDTFIHHLSCGGESLLGLFQLQTRISFPFLRAKDSRRYLLIMRTSIFLNSPVGRGYIRNFSVHLVHKYFPHDSSTDIISCSEQKNKGI